MSQPSPNRKVVLITGASGGLGSGMVKVFAAAGWAVAAATRKPAVEPDAPFVFPVQMDVTSQPEVDAAMAGVVGQFGRIDVLINNAGAISDGPVWSLEDPDWDRVMDVNLKGAFRCARAAIRPMLKQRSGHIINVASFSARTGTAGQSNYAAAKAGLIGLTQSLAREAGSRNVRANAVLPGLLDTAMTAALTSERRAQFAADNALGRWNDIAEVARFVEFLANMQNVSGQLFQLDSRIAPWT